MIHDVIHFCVAQDVDLLTAHSARNTILMIWEPVYNGLANMLGFDDSSCLRDNFVEICEIYNEDENKSVT